MNRFAGPAGIALMACAASALALKPVRGPTLLESSSSPPRRTRSTPRETTSTFQFYSGEGIENTEQFRLYGGTGNPLLVEDIAKYLKVPVSSAELSQFADGEVSVKINDTVRGKDCFVVQPTGPPVNDNLVELLLLVSCLRRSSARRITVVMPYYAYARADLILSARTPISAKDVAVMLETVGADRLMVVDFHSSQIQGFFPPRVPTDSLSAVKVGGHFFADLLRKEEVVEPRRLVVVAPRESSVERAREFRNVLVERGVALGDERLSEAQLAMVVRHTSTQQRRIEATLVRDAGKDADDGEVLHAASEASLDRPERSVRWSQLEIVGEDAVEGADVILVDDIYDSCRTMTDAAQALKARGAKRIYTFAAHGLFSGKAVKRVNEAPIDCVVVTDTVAIPQEVVEEFDAPVHTLTLAPLIAEAVRRVHEKKSLAEIFE